MKKRIVALLLCIAMMVSMVGCVGVGIVPKQMSDSEQEPAEQVTATPVVSETPAPTEEPTPTPVVSEEPTPTPVVSPDAGVAVISEEGDDASDETGITLTAVPAGVTPVEESLGTQIAYVANNTVTVYEYYENGALGMVITDAKGDQIELTKKFTYTVDGVDTVIYHYAACDYESAIGAADDANYQFILASDVTFTAEEVEPTPTPTPSLTPTDKTDDATGVAISANLPADVTLDVAAKTLAESGLDTTAYPVNGASLFYDVTLLQSGAEYQPTEGITITFPEAAITNSGLAVGDWYKVYHIHDGATDVTGPFEYTGGAIEASFDSLSVVGVASTTNIDLTTVFGEYQSSESYYGYAVINSDSIRVYGAVDSENTDYIDYTGVQGIAIELVNEKAIYEKGNLYFYTYSGDENLVSGYFIPEEFITITCCASCTGAAGCTCGCESCTCGDAGTLVLTDPTTGIMVSGVLPAGTQLKVTDATTSTIPGLTVSHLQYKTDTYSYHNISLLDADGNPLADNAFDTVMVYVPNVWNTSYSDPIVDVYHLNDDGSLNEMLTTRNGTVALIEGGGVIFEVSSFSDYAFVSGDTDSNISVTQGSHTLYVTPGSTGTLTLQSTNDVTLSTTTPVSGVTVKESTSGQSTVFTVTVASSATLNSTGTFTITYRGGMEGGGMGKPGDQNNGTRTATYTVKVVSAEEANKQAFVGNTISHIQIDIECSAVVLGYNNNQSTAIDLNYSQSNSTNQLTKVLDDSAVGFHYELTYTVDGVETTVIVRVDESATNLPTGVEYSDIAEQWTVTGITTEDGQISFNGTIPVGTKTNPVVYSVTVNSTFNLVPTNGTTAEAVDVSISNSLGYWYTTNECPGLNHSTTDWEAGSVISGSGIDLSKFTMGSVLGETTYYVVFSNLTKVVNGYTFGTGETKNYVFTIYRDLLVDDTTTTDINEAEVVEWVAFDTISITADGATSSTNFTTDATKYSVDNITKYQYKIVETGYSISGYGCTNQIEVKNGDSYTVSSDGVFAFNRTASTDGKTVTYSAEIKCTNTYTEAGLTVNKVVTNAPESAANDEFTVKVWPNQLSTTGVDTDNMYTYFNTGTYKVGGTALTVTNSSSTTEYGYITLTLKAGESKTITGLPAGTYYVQEQAGTNTNYIYDTEQESANLTSGSASVTINNEYKIGSLTITKTVDGLSEEVKNGQSYEFTVSGQTEKIVLNQANNWTHTIENLVAGDYTITETTPQIDASTGYRYVDTNITGDVKDVGALSATAVVPAGDTATVTYKNIYEPLAKLTVVKEAKGILENLRTYDFTITYPDGTTKTITLGLLLGWSKELTNLQPGSYTITEGDPTTAAGHKYKSTAIEGADTIDGLKATITLGSGDERTVKYTNIYEQLGDLTIQKEVVGLTDTLKDAQEFSFTLTGPNGTQAFTLNAENNWTFTLNDIALGDYTVVENLGENGQAPANYEYLGTVITGADKSEGLTASFNIGVAEAEEITFTNNYRGLGNLTVSKTVVEAENASYVIDKEQTFTFAIDFNDSEAHAYTGSYTGTITEQGTVTLKHGESITFTNVPEQVTYTVTETAVDGFTTTATGEKVEDKVEGKVVSGTITTGETDTAAFTNTYSTELGDLEITKTISHKDYDKHEGGDFDFTVTGTTAALPGEYDISVLQGENELEPDKITVTVVNGVNIVEFTVRISMTDTDDSQTIVITGLPVGNYTVQEVEGNLNYDYDRYVYNDVQVTAGEENAKVGFTNSYPRQANSLTINKNLVNGSTRDVTDSFTFKVTMPEDVKFADYKENLIKLNGNIFTEIDGEERTFMVTISDLTAAKDSTATKNIVIRGLPTGVYTIKEVDYAGYTADFGDGKDETTATITSEAAASVTCTNTVITGTLKITKEAPDSELFLFHVTGPDVYMDILVPGGGSQTIYKLPLGEYTVTEDTDWSWRYNLAEGSPVWADNVNKLTDDVTALEVTFTNTKRPPQWLSDIDIKYNAFGATN